jgi:hypothetical protein
MVHLVAWVVVFTRMTKLPYKGPKHQGVQARPKGDVFPPPTTLIPYAPPHHLLPHSLPTPCPYAPTPLHTQSRRPPLPHSLAHPLPYQGPHQLATTPPRSPATNYPTLCSLPHSLPYSLLPPSLPATTLPATDIPPTPLSPPTLCPLPTPLPSPRPATATSPSPHPVPPAPPLPPPRPSSMPGAAVKHMSTAVWAPPGFWLPAVACSAPNAPNALPNSQQQ